MSKKRGKPANPFGPVLNGSQPKQGSSVQPGRRRIWLGIVLGVVAMVCLTRLIVYLVGSAQSRAAQETLRAQHDQMEMATQAPTAPPQAEETAPTGTPVPLPTPNAPSPLPSEPPVSGDYQFIGSEAEILDSMRKLYQRNGDLVGWLKIAGVVDLPVVYRDNAYYLYRDFDGGSSNAGTLFLDKLHPLEADTQQLVIHGHNMRDGSMFGRLLRYRNRDYAVKHSVISWTTLYRKETYDVFGVVVTTIDPKDDRYIAYLGKARFKTEEHFRELMEQYRRQAVYWRDLGVTKKDAILTLSTCIGDDRLLVIARRRDR